MKKMFFLLVLIALSTSKLSYSQEIADSTNIDTLVNEVNGEIATPIIELKEDTIYPLVEQLQSDLKVVKKLKISGYVQAQYQKADTAGINSVAGGAFGGLIDNRMMIRRGRLKFAYENELSQAVLQFDLTEKSMGIKDAYLSLTEPWLKTVSVTGGVFDRPFGYEISYSSSARETPERSRVFQTLFPGERETGAKITLQAPKTSNWNWIKLDAGYFNGNGPTVETDNKKDFIGHLSLSKVSRSEKFKWGLGGSYYCGGFAQSTTSAYKMAKDANGVAGFIKSTVAKTSPTFREYTGVDAQLSLDWWLGITQVRAEYLLGTQPAFAGSSSSLQGVATGDVYNRKFEGYYCYFIQNIFETPVQLVAKYDVYDPNTSVAGNQIGSSVASGFAKTGIADLKYSTLGLGINYRWNSNVKIMAYYDIVTNETTSKIPNKDNLSSTTPGNTLQNHSKNIKDNVFTLRLQYKF